MDFKEQINNDLKAAMKSGDKIRLETIRSIRALILEFEKSGSGKELTEDEAVKLVSGAVKKRRDSIDLYRKAGREDLAGKEEAELNILLDYLPKQLSEDEILAKVKEIAGSIGASSKDDFPKLMPEVMKQLKGKAEGKIVKDIVLRFLESK